MSRCHRVSLALTDARSHVTHGNRTGGNTSKHPVRRSTMSIIEHVRVEHPVSAKIHRLSTASAKRVIEPDTDLPGHIGPGQILPDDLLSVAGLDLELSD